MDKEALAVLAYGLLGTVAALVDSADRLTTTWPGLDDAERARLLEAVRDHASWIGDVLQGLVRGLPDDVLTALGQQALSSR